MGLFRPKIRPDIQRKKDELKPEVFISVTLAGGLPLPEGSICQIYYCKEKIVIDGNNASFVIPLNRVHDISTKAETEIQKQVVSSAGGAVAGAMMFGPIGAIIGGRTKTKTTKKDTIYLFITYQSENGEIKYIAFNVTGTLKSHEIVKLFSQREKDEKVVIL